jgi:prepilin-type N-terminal cleavage/methylation domain-containing protein
MSHRRGFSLLEIVIAVTIVALLAAVIVSAVVVRLQDSRSAAVAQTLASLSDGILEYRADVRRYPKNLRYLSTSPIAGVTDLCDQTVPASFRSLWRGPYTKTAILSSGMTLQEMIVSDTLELNPTGPYTVTTNGSLVIVTRDVDSTIARELETRYDGNVDWTAGTIRFTHVAGGKGTLRFAVPVRGC